MTYLSHATTLIGGSFLSLGMYNHLKPLLPATVLGLPKIVPLVGIVGLTFLGFHVGGKLAEKVLPVDKNKSYLNLKTIVRPIGQALLGIAFVVCQLAILEFSGLLLSDEEVLLAQYHNLLQGEITPSLMLKTK